MVPARGRWWSRACWCAGGSAAGLVAAFVVTTNGCAGLPDAQREFSVAHVPPQVTADAVTAGGGILGRHLLVEQAINPERPLVGGNRLQLLQDGPATYDAMRAAIAAATDHVNLQTYVFEDDEVGRGFAALLAQRAADGVTVNVIYDSFGTIETPARFFDALREAGVNLIEFNPVNPLVPRSRTLRVNHRGHRKLMVVDGAVAFVGGINISADYASGSFVTRVRRPGAERSGWRDTHLRIEGPAVTEFQRLFVETWASQGGEPLAAERYVREVPVAGDETVRAIGSTPDDERSVIYLTLLAAVQHAEDSVHMTIAYFAPDAQFLDALGAAARRGVDVKLIMPAKSDVWPIFHVGRSYYEALMDAGVEIYERRGSVMHAKTAVIDGVWSTVGSSNIDWRSFLYNDELNAVILGRDFAAQMETMFHADLAHSDRVEPDQWRARPLSLRSLEWAARLIERGL